MSPIRCCETGSYATSTSARSARSAIQTKAPAPHNQMKKSAKLLRNGCSLCSINSRPRRSFKTPPRLSNQKCRQAAATDTRTPPLFDPQCRQAPRTYTYTYTCSLIIEASCVALPYTYTYICSLIREVSGGQLLLCPGS